jgi:acetyl-CoA C-acetyltransferase
MNDSRDVVICSPLRTPVGRYGGVFRNLQAADLAATVIRALVQRTGIAGEVVDDVILGQCYPSGEAPAIGRVAALDAGLPVTVAGAQVDRRCGSGLMSVIMAAMQVEAGACDVVIAGGAESMSNADYYAADARWNSGPASFLFHDRLVRARVTAGGRDYVVPGGMIETAENLRREFGITRAAQDELAVLSHERAVAAQRDGRFAHEIVPVTVPGRQGSVEVSDDEHPRADTTLDKLSTLRPVRASIDPESTVTAGNASGQNDGASVCIVTHRAKAEELGLTPLARLSSWAVAGVLPSNMGIGPVPATERALDRIDMKLEDMDLIEVNEAFAAQVLACTAAWGLGRDDFERLNVNGSGISLGHPVGATGCRILTTLLYEMQRREARFGLETMCIGGGQGLAAVFELVGGH